jgi:hypothetical protein
MSEGGAKDKAPDKPGAQRKGRERQKPDKLGLKKVKSGAGRGAAKSKHAAKRAAGGRASETRKAEPTRILAGTTTRSGDKRRAKASQRRASGGSSNRIVSESQQRIHDRLNQAAVTAASVKPAGHKQSGAGVGAESNQSRFARVTTTAINHPLILFVQVPIYPVINLAGLQLRWILHHPRAPIFNLVTRCVCGGACFRWRRMRSLSRAPSVGMV